MDAVMLNMLLSLITSILLVIKCDALERSTGRKHWRRAPVRGAFDVDVYAYNKPVIKMPTESISDAAEPELQADLRMGQLLEQLTRSSGALNMPHNKNKLQQLYRSNYAIDNDGQQEATNFNFTRPQSGQGNALTLVERAAIAVSVNKQSVHTPPRPDLRLYLKDKFRAAATAVTTIPRLATGKDTVTAVISVNRTSEALRSKLKPNWQNAKIFSQEFYVHDLGGKKIVQFNTLSPIDDSVDHAGIADERIAMGTFTIMNSTANGIRTKQDKAHGIKMKNTYENSQIKIDSLKTDNQRQKLTNQTHMGQNMIDDNMKAKLKSVHNVVQSKVADPGQTEVRNPTITRTTTRKSGQQDMTVEVEHLSTEANKAEKASNKFASIESNMAEQQQQQYLMNMPHMLIEASTARIVERKAYNETSTDTIDTYTADKSSASDSDASAHTEGNGTAHGRPAIETKTPAYFASILSPIVSNNTLNNLSSKSKNEWQIEMVSKPAATTIDDVIYEAAKLQATASLPPDDTDDVDSDNDSDNDSDSNSNSNSNSISDNDMPEHENGNMASNQVAIGAAMHDAVLMSAQKQTIQQNKNVTMTAAVGGAVSTNVKTSAQPVNPLVVAIVKPDRFRSTTRATTTTTTTSRPVHIAGKPTTGKRKGIKRRPAADSSDEEIESTNWWHILPYADIRKFLNTIYDSFSYDE